MSIKNTLLFILLICFVKSYSQTEDLNFQLLEAAYEGDESELAKAIKNGADVNTQTYEGTTALMYAAQEGHTDIVKILIHNGAEVNKKDNYGSTALYLASKMGHLHSVKALLEAEAEPDVSTKYGRKTPLMLAIAYNHTEIAKWLISYGADINKKGWNNDCPLSLAVYTGNYYLTSLLLENGADPNTKDKYGYTPYHIAVQYDDTLMVKLLTGFGAKIQSKSKSGLTPFSYAVRQNKVPLMKFLVRHDSNTLKVIKGDPEILRYSIINENPETRRFLKKHGAPKASFPVIKSLIIDYGIHTSFSGSMFSHSFGFYEGITNLGLSIGFDTRYKAHDVLVPYQNNEYYQLWERRYAFNTTLFKDFSIKSWNSNHFGFRLGFKEAYSFGNYKAMEMKPESKFVHSPEAGMFITIGSFGLILKYAYSDFGIHEVSPHRLGINFFFNRKLISQNTQIKKIVWLER